MLSTKHLAAQHLRPKWRAATVGRTAVNGAHRSCRSPVAAPGPVLTFLSPCPARSADAVGFLGELFHLPRIAGSSESGIGRGDSLDELHFGSSSSPSWDSVACACPSSGTILHFLSLSTENGQAKPASNGNPQSALSLMAIHASHLAASTELPLASDEDVHRDVLMESRQRLARQIQERQIISHNGMARAEARLRGLLLKFMCGVLGRQPNPSWILDKIPSSSHATSPLLDLASAPPLTHEAKSSEDIDGLSERSERFGKLRELALPFFPGVSSLQTDLSRSSLLRPLPGLYQCAAGTNGNNGATKRNTTGNPGLIFRPLPAAQEDLRLSSPSLVFQCESLEKAQELVEGRLGGRTFKIGWRGHGQLGSLMVTHPSIAGIDIRICEVPGSEWVLSSSFDEAQESLLAGSLAELQSTRVVSEGKGDDVDKKSGNGDCWVEFRSNVQHPTGFVKQITSSLLQKQSGTRVAKPPDIPYE